MVQINILYYIRCTNYVFIIHTIPVRVAKGNIEVRTKLDEQFNKENPSGDCVKRRERNYPQTKNQPLSLLLNDINQIITNFMNHPIN